MSLEMYGITVPGREMRIVVSEYGAHSGWRSSAHSMLRIENLSIA